MAGLAPETALSLSLEELAYLVVTRAREQLAYFAPLSPDPAAYADAVVRAFEHFETATPEEEVDAFLAARASAYGGRADA